MSDRYGRAVLPEPRGPVSAIVRDALLRAPHDLPAVPPAAFTGVDPVTDEDLQLTLFLCYELHYRGWHGVDDAWEWQPSLLAVRAMAERRFEEAIRSLVGSPPVVRPEDLPAALHRLTTEEQGPSLGEFLKRRGTLAQFREFVVHRSVYHLREADPHSWGLPRLGGLPKAALVEIQMDEYGNGQLHRMHAELFRTTIGRLGLDTSYGAYLNAAPAITLATNNAMSLFGLHRRLRGALVGHLAAFEMTSSLPNRRYGDALRRLGGDTAATRFFDEHVEADAVHEQIAMHDLCGGLARQEPALTADVLLGAATVLALDDLFARHLLSAWAAGRSSLRPAAREPWELSTVPLDAPRAPLATGSP